METAHERLTAHLAAIHDLGQAGALLAWDQQTMMPPRGAAVRAEQLATITRLAHEHLIGDETGRLLAAAEDEAATAPADSLDASLIRVARRDHDKARRVPAALEAEMARAGAQAYAVWKEAKPASDFARFLPHLERALELKHRYVDCFDDVADPYDALLDDFEPGLTTAEVAEVLGRLKTGLVPLVAWVTERAGAVDDACLAGDFPAAGQRRFVLGVIERFGYEPDAWRLDPTAHPFASSLGIEDIRLTTRFDDGHLSQGLFATMHECGHGLYEAGVDPAFERTPLARGASMAMHESQSRTWENLVGRSRPFWRPFFPTLRDTFPDQLGGTDEETFYRAVNRMAPSFIRVEADEATYNLHIVLRFELERELLAGDVRPRDLPEAWNARMRDSLGIVPPDSARGCLQDVHWADGLFGYFPTYALGNIVAAQLFERARADVPDLDDQFARGEFGALRGWQREHIHRHGRAFTAPELLARTVGGPMDPAPLLHHLRAKVTELYGVPPAATD